MTVVTWREKDGLHRSYASGETARLVLDMIESDDTMTLIEVRHV